MQEYNKAVEALNDPELLAQFHKEQDRLMQELMELNAQTKAVALPLPATTRNQKKRARRKVRGKTS